EDRRVAAPEEGDEGDEGEHCAGEAVGDRLVARVPQHAARGREPVPQRDDPVDDDGVAVEEAADRSPAGGRQLGDRRRLRGGPRGGWRHGDGTRWRRRAVAVRRALRRRGPRGTQASLLRMSSAAATRTTTT